MKKQRKKTNLLPLVAIEVVVLAVLLVAVLLRGCSGGAEELTCKTELTMEAGGALPQAGDFFETDTDAVFLTDLQTLSAHVPGTYAVELQAGEKTYSSTLRIVDTVAPRAQAVDLTVTAQSDLEAEDFVTEIVDATEVTVTFVTAPDWNISGTQNIAVLLTDAAGNTATVEATLTYVKDEQPPVISGAKDLEAYVGGTVSYKSGITVTDDMDTDPSLKVDNSQVDLTVAGVYPVTYTATDAAGNVTVVTVNLTVREKPEYYVEPEQIYARVDAILAQFIREDMTDREKVEAVYVWTRRGVHLNYGSGEHSDDYLQLANLFLDVRKGDCYSFHAIQKLMLQRLGIPTIDVYKVKNSPEDSNHVWLLVSVDGGETYYHMDNTWSMYLCLVTDAELDDFSAGIDSHPFNRDTALYPATPEEKLPASTLPWEDPDILGATP